MGRKKACEAKRKQSANCSSIKSRTLWKWRRARKIARNFGSCAGNSLRATGLTKLNQDVVVPRSHIVDLIEFAERLHAKYGFPIACFGHAGDGNIHINIMADRYNRDADVRKKVEQALDDLFAQVLAWGGVITGEHGIGLAKKRWWPDATSGVVRELHRKLKDVLDPNGILNPGKFVE